MDYLHWESRVLASTNRCCSIIESVYFIFLVPHDGHFKKNAHKEKWHSLKISQKKEKKEFYIIKVLNIFYNSKQCLHEISTTWSYEIHVQSIVTLKKSLNIASLTCKYSLKKGSFLLGGRGVVPIEIEHWIQDLHTNHLFIYLFEKKNYVLLLLSGLLIKQSQYQ